MGRNNIKSILAGIGAGAILAIAPGTALAHGNSDHGDHDTDNHVTICHRTDSNSNPYVMISPDVSAVYHGHYEEHQGPVYPSAGWGDIIPPFTYHGQSYSLNWSSQGQAIYNNGCAPISEGGQGGGPSGGGGGGTTPTPTPPPSGGQVLGASTVSPGMGAGPQVAIVPSGSVNGGEGGAGKTSNPVALVGLTASVLGVGSGLGLLKQRKL